MEQFIDIKYINNLVNLGFSDINSYPNLNLKDNLTKFSHISKKEPKLENASNDNRITGCSRLIAKIKQIENIRNKVFILLDNFVIKNEGDPNNIIYKNSSILSYDIKTEAVVLQSFDYKKADDFMKLFIIEDEIYSILGTRILCLDHKNLEIIREWDIGEKFYNFCIYETSQILKMNLDIFYVNFQNELKFFGKCILFDIKQKTLYKEQNMIDKILFHEDLLMWSSNFTLKIFDLKNKQMILRKSYDDVKEDIIKNNLNDFESIINDEFYYSVDNNIKKADEFSSNNDDNTVYKLINKSILADKFKTINFCITNDLLSLNVGNKIIHILKIEKLKPPPNNNFLGLNLGFNLPNISPTSAQKFSKLYKVYDLFAFKTSINSKFLGYWINSSQNKLSIVKVINPRDKNYKFIELNIIKIDTNEGSSEFLLKKNVEKIITNNDFRYSYSEKYANFFIFDDSEIYNFSLIDKEERVLSDLKNNLLNGLPTFNLIYDNFNKFDLPQRVFIVFKTLRNYERLGIDIEKLSEDKKLIYMIDSIINSSDQYKKLNILDVSEIKSYGKDRIEGTNNKNDEDCVENYRSVNYENLIHIFNIFIKNRKFYYIYKIFRKYLKRFFNYISISKKISNGQANDFLANIHSQSRYDYMIEKKVMGIIDRIIMFCITKVLKPKINKDESKNIENGSEFNSSKETQSNLNDESKSESKENLDEDNNNNNNNPTYINMNLEVLTDILRFNFSLQPKDFSLTTINLILKIFHSKIKILNEKTNNGKKLVIFEDNIDDEDIFIDDSLFDESEQKVINREFYANLLDFNLLSKLFLKMKDYKRAIRSLIYNNNFNEIFDLIKQRKIPFENIENDFGIILENFSTEQIILLIEILFVEENIDKEKDVTYTSERFLNLILDVNLSKFDPKNSQMVNKNSNENKHDMAFEIFDVLESILQNDKIKYFNKEYIAERYLFYILDYLIHETKNNDACSDEKLKNDKSKDIEKYINIIKRFIMEYNKFDLKKILNEYKKELYDNLTLNTILITIYELIKEFKPIIDIQIDVFKDPEVSIRFIDSLDIFHSKKEELFEYLKNKIIKSEFLTPIKKFYFINLFEDGDKEEDKKTLINQIYEVKDEEDKKYILLILEQFRLKLKILQISKSLAAENLSKMNKEFKKLSLQGAAKINILNANKLKLNCDYKFCKEKEIKKGDSIRMFFNCKHLFHKKCIEVYNSKVALFDNKPNPSMVDIDRIEEFENIYNQNILLNLEKDNSDDICDCLICSQYEI